MLALTTVTGWPLSMLLKRRSALVTELTDLHIATEGVILFGQGKQSDRDVPGGENIAHS